MRGICILTETFYPVTGGGETQALALATGFVRSGYPVCVMTRRNDRALPRAELLEGVRIHRVAPAGAGQLRKWSLLFTAFAGLLHQCRHYDCIIVSGYRILGIPAMLAGLLLGKRTILKADNMGEMSGEYFRDGLARIGLRPGSLPVRLFLRLRNALLKKCSAFVVISSPVRQELQSHGVPEAAMVQIPNSVDTGRFHPVDAAARRALRRALDIPQDAFVVAYTGRLVDYKGLPLLLRVWREAHAAYGDCRLLLVGAGGMDIHNCEAELRAFARDNGLERSVVFAGSVSDVQRYLQAADVFVLPTEREAFGISLIEAMACGLPVIATRVGGIPDIVEAGVNGCLVPAADSGQLRSMLDTLYHDVPLRLRLGNRARETVEQRYSQTAVVERYAKLVDELAAHGGRGPRA